jgi:hypothetical protein
MRKDGQEDIRDKLTVGFRNFAKALKNSYIEQKERAFKYIPHAALNYAFSCLRLVRHRGKLLKILMPS